MPLQLQNQELEQKVKTLQVRIRDLEKETEALQLRLNNVAVKDRLTPSKRGTHTHTLGV